MINIQNKGLIRIVVIIILAILVLSYFRIDLRSVVSSDTTQGNFSFAWSFVQNVWYNYVKTPIIFLLHFVLNIIQ